MMNVVMIPRRIPLIIASFGIWLLFPTAEHLAFGDDNAWFVRKFNDTKPWDRFVDSPIAIRVEGRLGSSGGGQFRLLRCDARFTVDPGKLKLIPAKSTVEVRGRFKRDGQRIDFVVDDIKVLPSYVSQFETRSSRLIRPTADEWVALGDWATERAKFYDDEELQKKATEAYLNSIDVEYKSLKATDFDGRFALARKIAERDLSRRREMELIHEGLQLEWLSLQKNEPVNPVAWQRFSTKLAEQLPGAKEPLKTVKAELKESYEQDPVSVYNQTAEDKRNPLHRLFFILVTRKIILFDESTDGHDGDAIADLIDRQIPEEHVLAEKHRTQRINYRLENITTATRPEIENLAILLRKRNRPDEARRALRDWIKSHEVRLKDDGVIGRLQLADEYLMLLNDEASAVENLKEAFTLDPNYEAVRSKLAALGYRWDNVRWQKQEAMSRDAATAESSTPTGILPGMTATAVRTLLGQPSSLTRAITSRGTTEIWCFGPKGTTQLIIRLEQKGRDPELKVTAFSGQ